MEHRAREVNCSRCLFGHFDACHSAAAPQLGVYYGVRLAHLLCTDWLDCGGRGATELCRKLFRSSISVLGGPPTTSLKVQLVCLVHFTAKTASIVREFFAILVLFDPRDMFVSEFSPRKGCVLELLLIKISCERGTLLQDFINIGDCFCGKRDI